MRSLHCSGPKQGNQIYTDIIFGSIYIYEIFKTHALVLQREAKNRKTWNKDTGIFQFKKGSPGKNEMAMKNTC